MKHEFTGRLTALDCLLWNLRGSQASLCKFRKNVRLFSAVSIFYLLIGLSFLGLTMRAVFAHREWINIPLFYVTFGAIGAAFGLPLLSPLASNVELKIIEHISELIVIISLAGAGLAIDLKASWRNWQPTWRLLIVSMPLTVMAVAGLGYFIAGLPLAGAVLLGAALAPTDPVLARSVQVGTPGSQQPGTHSALTSEAGLNDGLAFPFVWLAIGLAGAASASSFDWINWFAYDAVYRTIMGILAGVVVGWLMTTALFNRAGKAPRTEENPVLIVLSATFISYGLAEAFNGYGFLSVFIAARAGRVFSSNTEAEAYEVKAHKTADQLESVLLALLLLWLGIFIGSLMWFEWRWQHLFIALALIFIIRPVTGLLSLLGHDCTQVDRYKIAFFGIRGMGTIFYIAYAFSHGPFTQAAQTEIWAIATLTILISICVHGTLASRWMTQH